MLANFKGPYSEFFILFTSCDGLLCGRQDEGPKYKTHETKDLTKGGRLIVQLKTKHMTLRLEN